MGRKRFDDMPCPIAQTLNQVGDWWTLLIVRDAFLGARRFSDFHDSTGIAKNILTDRLNKLVVNGVMKREEVGVRGKRQEYVLTDKGRALLPVLVSMLQWGNEWICGEGEELSLLFDGETGQPISPVEVRTVSGQRVSASSLNLRPGPGRRTAAA